MAKHADQANSVSFNHSLTANAAFLDRPHKNAKKTVPPKAAPHPQDTLLDQSTHQLSTGASNPGKKF